MSEVGKLRKFVEKEVMGMGWEAAGMGWRLVEVCTKCGKNYGRNKPGVCNNCGGFRFKRVGCKEIEVSRTGNNNGDKVTFREFRAPLGQSGIQVDRAKVVKTYTEEINSYD